MNKAAFVQEIGTDRAMAPQTAVAPPALLLDSVSHAYHRNVVLDGISLTLARGEILALVGHSGSGKSTLLRIVAGLETPLAGRVEINGREMTAPHHRVPAEKRGVGFMFQDYALFPHMSVAANVMFGLRGFTHAERRDAASRVLERVGLAALAGSYPHQLSGGEQQRVALARALAPHPAVLLMDEPFSNLDRGTRDLVRDETVAVLRQTGATAILVTHDPEDAMRTADRIVLLRAGRAVQAGTAEDLYHRPDSLFVARFFSEFNEIEGRCVGGQMATPVGSVAAPGFADGARGIVCVRPNCLRLVAAGAGRVNARILSRRFLGDTTLYLAEIGGLARPLQIRTPIGTGFAEGARVAVDFLDKDVLVFPGGDEAGAMPAVAIGRRQ
jgi:iron(III) transport system ATP-binding protein